MGQRSQIYIAYDKGFRNSKGCLEKRDGRYLIARYYQWNFGSRMVSRGKGLIEWILENLEYMYQNPEKISRITDINWDFHDIVIGQNIIEEEKNSRSPDDGEDYTPYKYIFEWQDNNDGKLFISVEDDGKIKYAFTDNDISAPLTAEGYIYNGDYDTEEECGSNYSENCKYIEEHATLMTEAELDMFVHDNYCNIEWDKEKKI